MRYNCNWFELRLLLKLLASTAGILIQGVFWFFDVKYLNNHWSACAPILHVETRDMYNASISGLRSCFIFKTRNLVMLSYKFTKISRSVFLDQLGRKQTENERNKSTVLQKNNRLISTSIFVNSKFDVSICLFELISLQETHYLVNLKFFYWCTGLKSFKIWYNPSPNEPDNPWCIFKDLQGQRISLKNLRGIRTTPDFLKEFGFIQEHWVSSIEKIIDENKSWIYSIKIICVVFPRCCSLACWSWRWSTVAGRCFGQLRRRYSTVGPSIFNSRRKYLDSSDQVSSRETFESSQVRLNFRDSFAGPH